MINKRPSPTRLTAGTTARSADVHAVPSRVHVHGLGFGTAPLGNLYAEVGEADAAAALAHVAGYLISNDVSEREYQLEHGGQWVKGKGCDTFAPLGPWRVTRDEIPDPQNLALQLSVNGHRYQNGNTRTMIFDVATLVSYISRYMTLQPGDVISIGTPPGVGLGQKPPHYLRPGDVMELAITGLGTQRQQTVAGA